MHRATLADLDALPESVRGELIDGELHVFPRPDFLHNLLAGNVLGDLRGPFQKGRGGPGGWRTLFGPGIHLTRAPEFAPDLAGWRRTTMNGPLRDERITLVPDWICEILSPSTRGYDLITKHRFYAEIGVPYLWYIDPDARALTVSKLQDGRWVELGVHGPDEKIRAEPFDAIELDLSDWWTDFPAALDPDEPTP